MKAWSEPSSALQHYDEGIPLLDIKLNYGYNIAIMRYEIIVSLEACEDLRMLDAHNRAKVRDLMEAHLRYEPTKTSKSRIKRLKGLRHPQYRLRIGEIRVFYDIEEDRVEVLAIITKSGAAQWLEKAGEKD